MNVFQKLINNKPACAGLFCYVPATRRVGDN